MVEHALNSLPPPGLPGPSSLRQGACDVYPAWDVLSSSTHLPLTVLLVGLAFWGWMFRDILDNVDLPRGAKESWTFAYVIFNVFAAVIYYVQEYRNR